jgi:hypothetical protein
MLILKMKIEKALLCAMKCLLNYIKFGNQCIKGRAQAGGVREQGAEGAK